MRFVLVSRTTDRSKGVYWREVDGTYVVSLIEGEECPVSDSAGIHLRGDSDDYGLIEVVHTGKFHVDPGLRHAKGEFQYLKVEVPPQIYVRPYNLGHFVVADILDAFSRLPSGATRTKAIPALQGVLRMYHTEKEARIIGAGRSTTTIHYENFTRYRSQFPPPSSDITADHDPDGLDGEWVTGDGFVLKVRDITDRHLGNIVQHWADKVITTLADDEWENVSTPAAVKEAVRRGLISSPMAALQKQSGLI